MNAKEEALGNWGAMALFGEKYGNIVGVDHRSGLVVELCGGTHVGPRDWPVKIRHESAVAPGTPYRGGQRKARNYMIGAISTVRTVREILKNPKELESSVETW